MLELINTTVLEKYQSGSFTEYRIPAIVVMNDGTLITAYEARRGQGGDWAEIWIGVRRSTDGGRSFSEVQYPHQKITDLSVKGTITWNNPVLIADGDLLHLFFCSEYARVWYCRSQDHGVEFSEPVEITGCFEKFPFNWNVCAVGPGHGIVASDGRLIVPIWVASGAIRMDLDQKGRIKEHSPSKAGCIVSDDRGKTWTCGFLADEIENGSETAVVQLQSGEFLFNFRNTGPDGCRLLGISDRNLRGLTKQWSESSLPDPCCMGSMVNADGRVYFVNCMNSAVTGKSLGKRINLTITESLDDGKSFKPVFMVDKIGGYADIAADKDRIYVFYEKGMDGKIHELVLKCYHRTGEYSDYNCTAV